MYLKRLSMTVFWIGKMKEVIVPWKSVEPVRLEKPT